MLFGVAPSFPPWCDGWQRAPPPEIHLRGGDHELATPLPSEEPASGNGATYVQLAPAPCGWLADASALLRSAV